MGESRTVDMVPRLMATFLALAAATQALPAYTSCLQAQCPDQLNQCAADATCAAPLRACLSEAALYDVFVYASVNISHNNAVNAVLNCGNRSLCHDQEGPESTLDAQCVADHCLDSARKCSQSDGCVKSWQCAQSCGLSLACVTGCASKSPLYAPFSQCTKKYCKDPEAPVGEGAVCCPCTAQHNGTQCTAGDAKCRRPAPPCKAPLKCYSSSLIDSGTCMATPFAEKGETCCIFCKTFPPCDTGFKCETADPQSAGSCVDPWP